MAMKKVEGVRVNIKISQGMKKYYERLSAQMGQPMSSVMAMALLSYMDKNRLKDND